MVRSARNLHLMNFNLSSHNFGGLCEPSHWGSFWDYDMPASKSTLKKNIRCSNGKISKTSFVGIWPNMEILEKICMNSRFLHWIRNRTALLIKKLIFFSLKLSEWLKFYCRKINYFRGFTGKKKLLVDTDKKLEKILKLNFWKVALNSYLREKITAYATSYLTFIFKYFVSHSKCVCYFGPSLSNRKKWTVLLLLKQNALNRIFLIYCCF